MGSEPGPVTTARVLKLSAILQSTFTLLKQKLESLTILELAYENKPLS